MADKTINVLVLQPDGPSTGSEVHQKASFSIESVPLARHNEFVRDTVGGGFDWEVDPSTGAILYVYEYSLLEPGYPPNRLATGLRDALSALRYPDLTWPHPLCGVAVAAGPPDADADETSYTEQMFDIVTSLLTTGQPPDLIERVTAEGTRYYLPDGTALGATPERLQQLIAHYNEMGERLKAQIPPGSYYPEVAASEAMQADLRDLAGTKAAIREMAAELGVDWTGGEFGMEPDLKPGALVDPTKLGLELGLRENIIDGQHRTGRRRRKL